VGAPVYFDGANTLVLSFLERFFGYRHVSVPIAGKPFFLAVAGAMMLDNAVEQIRKMLGHFEVDVRDVATFQSRVPPCFKCGRHKECKIGGLYMMLGDAAHQLTITPEMFSRWEDDADAVATVERVAANLKQL